jgi:hypothetical protein
MTPHDNTSVYKQKKDIALFYVFHKKEQGLLSQGSTEQTSTHMPLSKIAHE